MGNWDSVEAGIYFGLVGLFCWVCVRFTGMKNLILNEKLRGQDGFW